MKTFFIVFFGLIALAYLASVLNDKLEERKRKKYLETASEEDKTPALAKLNKLYKDKKEEELINSNSIVEKQYYAVNLFKSPDDLIPLISLGHSYEPGRFSKSFERVDKLEFTNAALGIAGMYSFIAITKNLNYLIFCNGLSSHSRDKKANAKIYKIKIADISEVKVVVDSETVITTTKKGVIKRAVVGGALLGGAGAVVGALTAGSTGQSKDLISNINIELSINSVTEPFAKIIFQSGAPKNKKDCTENLTKANEWNSIISTAIKKKAGNISEA
jgi:hypothetical protein